MNPQQVDQRVKTSILIILLLSVLVRLLLIGNRWINADEGAHLMDASLVIDGYIPLLDFSSRQPFYTYCIAGIFKIFGTGLLQGRLFPLFFSLLVAFLVFKIGKQLLNESVGLLSAAIYMLLPLEIYNSIIVKTIPFVTFMICLNFYLLLLYFRHDKLLWLVLSGAAAALGYYVRESALIAPATAFVLLFLSFRQNKSKLIGGYAGYAIGYLAIVSGMLAFFARYLGWNVLFSRSLNPLSFIVKSFDKLTAFSKSSADVVQAAATSMHPDYGYYFNYILQAFYPHAFLLLALGFTLIKIYRQPLPDQINDGPTKENHPFLFLYTWTGFLFLAYAYHFLTRGFYIDYFREFLPPLSIACAAWLLDPENRLHLSAGFVWPSFFFSVVFFAIHAILPIQFGMHVFAFYICTGMVVYLAFRLIKNNYVQKQRSIAVVAAVILLLLLSFLRTIDLAGFLEILIWAMVSIAIILTFWVLANSTSISFSKYFNWSLQAVFCGSLVSGIVYSANTLGLSYDSSYSPAAVNEAVALIRDKTRKGDEVLSGSVIWEFESGRGPFQNISHPLGLISSMSKEQKDKILEGLEKSPPSIIVMDGFTEKIYFPHIGSQLLAVIDNDYKLLKSVGPAKYPVKIYFHKK